MKIILVSISLLVASVLSIDAQTNATSKRKTPHPSYAEVKEVKGLPRILLIGDSISMGYTLKVRSELEGKANVYRPKANCGPTDTGLKYIDKWLGGEKWDLIHFNWGLHDVMHYRNSVAREDRVPHASEGAFRRNSPEQYEEKLRKLVAKLQDTGATLIWASTTPIPDSSTGMWKPGDAAVYNKIAAKVMKGNKIEIDDLWTFIKPKIDQVQNEGDVHFSSKGSALLGSEVARVIEEALNKRRAE